MQLQGTTTTTLNSTFIYYKRCFFIIQVKFKDVYDVGENFLCACVCTLYSVLFEVLTRQLSACSSLHIQALSTLRPTRMQKYQCIHLYRKLCIFTEEAALLLQNINDQMSQKKQQKHDSCLLLEQRLMKQQPLVNDTFHIMLCYLNNLLKTCRKKI